MRKVAGKGKISTIEKILQGNGSLAQNFLSSYNSYMLRSSQLALPAPDLGMIRARDGADGRAHDTEAEEDAWDGK